MVEKNLFLILLMKPCVYERPWCARGVMVIGRNWLRYRRSGFESHQVKRCFGNRCIELLLIVSYFALLVCVQFAFFFIGIVCTICILFSLVLCVQFVFYFALLLCICVFVYLSVHKIKKYATRDTNKSLRSVWFTLLFTVSAKKVVILCS
jgi:uncharacterized sodium:solute symporter family permease YidK